MDLEREILKYLIDNKNSDFIDIATHLRSICPDDDKAILGALLALSKKNGWDNDNLIETKTGYDWHNIGNQYKKKSIHNTQIPLKITRNGQDFYSRNYKEIQPVITTAAKKRSSYMANEVNENGIADPFEVLSRIRELLKTAILFKERFDTKQSLEVIKAYNDVFKAHVKLLSDLCPQEVMGTGQFKRHCGFIDYWLNRGNIDSCHADINEICSTDIFEIEKAVLQYCFLDRHSIVLEYDWQKIHPVIHEVAMPRFESTHYADAVESAFKEVNDIVKKRYKEATGKELDGDGLMRNAFGSNGSNSFNPIIRLADNTTESGRNVQQGYMDIFAGSMKGIRNPKAHANLDVHPDEAWEMIVLASHLLRMWDKFN